MEYKVLFTGGIGAPRLTLADDYSTLDHVRSISESAAKALGHEYWWCGIFNAETGKLIEEFTVSHEPTIKR